MAENNATNTNEVAMEGNLDLASKAANEIVALLRSRTPEQELEADGIVSDKDVNIDTKLLHVEGNINLAAVEKMRMVGLYNKLTESLCIYTGKGYVVCAKRVDKGGGRTSFGLRILFKSGILTDIIEVRQSDLGKMMSYINATVEVSRDVSDKMPERRVFMKFRDDLQDYKREGVRFDVVGIIEAIDDNELIIPSEREIVDIEELGTVMSKMQEFVDNSGLGFEREFIIGKNEAWYYRFRSAFFGMLAAKVNMTETQLAKFFNKYGLLRLQASSVGYQCKVHFPTVAGVPESKEEDWAYCVYKPSFWAGMMKSNGNTRKVSEVEMDIIEVEEGKEEYTMRVVPIRANG